MTYCASRLSTQNSGFPIDRLDILLQIPTADVINFTLVTDNLALAAPHTTGNRFA